MAGGQTKFIHKEQVRTHVTHYLKILLGVEVLQKGHNILLSDLGAHDATSTQGQ